MLNGIADRLELYLLVSTLLFVFGSLTALTRRNAIGVFMGVELMLNAAALNFVAFQSLGPRTRVSAVDGHMFSLFIIVAAAIEAAVALAIVLRYFAVDRNVDPQRATELHG
jgi:NADH-quinone oxidoreductase subunit K